jgi:adenine phosphoribosyltransferase
MQAACHLVEQLGGTVVACVVLLELAFLEGRKKLPGHIVHAVHAVNS